MDAEYSMPEPTLLDPALKKVCSILLGLGAAVLTLDLYLGFIKHANSALVFSLLGITMVVFATVLFMLLQPSAFAFLSSAKSAPEPKATVAPEPTAAVNPEPEATVAPEPTAAVNPEPKATVAPEPTTAVNPEPEATVASEPKDAVEAQPKAEAIPQPETKVEPPAEPAPQTRPAAKSEPQLGPNTDLGKLLDTTLGDILVAALRKDPEGAGRIFARAVTQADASAPAAKAAEPKGRDSA
jgi:outer membrane biosynthesis protein TonB